MDDDIPIAHSMDTTFFAIDAAGHVGRFDSGEQGHAPEGAEDHAMDITTELWEVRHPGQAKASWWRLPGEQLANELGVYCYEYDEELIELIDIAPYRLVGAPRSPLHIDQLPPELRQLCKQIRFEKVNFGGSDLIQPIEQFRCTYWYQEDRVAYLCSDGKTVRPIPGMEDRFADFCKQFREANPEEAKKYVFEGVRVDPKKPRRRRRKENDDGK